MRRALLLVLVTACGDDVLCPEDRVSIASGPYGVIRRSCELKRCASDSPSVDGTPTPVAVYPAAPPGAPPPTGAAIASTVVDSRGFYQLGVDAGDYDLCLHFRNRTECTRITIDSVPVRWDWHFHPNPGFFWAMTICA